MLPKSGCILEILILLTRWIIKCEGQSEGDLRLTGGDDLSGFVEIYHDNQWGRVCDLAWDLNDAVVTCVQLGHNGASPSGMIPTGAIPPASQKVWLDRLQCTGGEATLSSCSGGQTWIQSGQTSTCQSAYVECLPFAPGYLGCYWDTETRILDDFSSCQDQSLCHDCDHSDKGCFRRDMDVQSCLSLCCGRNFAYAGLESQNECYCGDSNNDPTVSTSKLLDSQCSQRCSGNEGERCGGTYEIQIYECSMFVPPPTECEQQTAPTNGGINGERNRYTPGDTISFECNEGFVINGPDTITCQQGGSWSSIPPTCESILCPPLAFLNAEASTTERAYNTIVTFTCAEGYRHVRDTQPSLVCSNGAMWDGQGPDCRDETDCNVLPDYVNTTRSTESTASGVTVTFTCNSGLIIENSDIMTKTCTDPITWVGVDPVCEDINECEGTSPCQNGGVCENTFGDYMCSCSSLYIGKNCEFANVVTTPRTNGTGSGGSTGDGNFPTWAWVTILIVSICILLIFIAWLIIFRSRRKARAKKDPRLLPNRTAAVSPRQYNEVYRDGQHPRYGGGVKPGNRSVRSYGNNAYTDSLPAFSSATQSRAPSSHQRVTVPPGPSIGAGIARNVDRLPENTHRPRGSPFQSPPDRPRPAIPTPVVVQEAPSSAPSSAASTPRRTRRTPLPMPAHQQPPSRNSSSVSRRNPLPMATAQNPVSRSPSMVSNSPRPIVQDPVHPVQRPVSRNPSTVSSDPRTIVRNPSTVSTRQRPVTLLQAASGAPIPRPETSSAQPQSAQIPLAQIPSSQIPSAQIPSGPIPPVQTLAGQTSSTSNLMVHSSQDPAPTAPVLTPPVLPAPHTQEPQTIEAPRTPVLAPAKPVRRFPSNVATPPVISPRPMEHPSMASAPPPVAPKPERHPSSAGEPKSPLPVAPKPIGAPNAVRVLPPKTAVAVPRITPPHPVPTTSLEQQSSSDAKPSFRSPKPAQRRIVTAQLHSTDDDDGDAPLTRPRVTSEKKQNNVLAPNNPRKRVPSFNKHIDSELQRKLLDRRRFSTSDEESVIDNREVPNSVIPSGMRPGPSTGALKERYEQAPPGSSMSRYERLRNDSPSTSFEQPEPNPPVTRQKISPGVLAGAPLGDSPRSASPVDSLDGADGPKTQEEEKKEKDMLDDFFDGVKEKFDDCTIQ